MHKTLDAFVSFELMTLSESATARSVINHEVSRKRFPRNSASQLGASSQDKYCKSILDTVDGRIPAPVDR